MEQNKLAEYKKLQTKILNHLFEKAQAVSVADVRKLIEKPDSETQYHLDQLNNEKVISYESIGERHAPGYKITEHGRKRVMES